MKCQILFSGKNNSINLCPESAKITVGLLCCEEYFLFGPLVMQLFLTNKIPVVFQFTI